MKKSCAGFVLLLLIFTILIPCTTSAAQTTEPHTLITPGSIFYGYKIFGEWLKQKIVSIGGTQAEMNYVFQRIQNRETEMNTLFSQGKIDSTAYITAQNQEADLRQEFNTLLGKIQESDRWKILQQKKIDPGLPDEEYFRGDNYATLIGQKMNDVNKQLLAAQDSEDNAKVTSLTNQLKELKKSYTDANIILPAFAETEKQQLAQTEKLLAGADKINYAIEWANKYKKMIDDTSKNEIYRSSKDQFDSAQKTLDDLISNLKKIPLDNVDNKKLDDLFSQAKGTLNDTARGIWQKSLKENTVNLPPVENINSQKQTTEKPTTKMTTPKITNNPVAPALIEPANKPTLKIIPSSNVSTEPLKLFNYTDTYNVNVGEFFDHTWERDSQGGLPPYHFQLETAGGFPPFGIILDSNGRLSGTPTTPGTNTFGICLVDTAGKSDCIRITIVVIQVLKVNVTSVACIHKAGEESYYNKGNYVEAIGTANGPVGSSIEQPTGKGPDECPSWHLGGSQSYHYACERKDGDPEETTWKTTIAANNDSWQYSMGGVDFGDVCPK